MKIIAILGALMVTAGCATAEKREAPAPVETAKAPIDFLAVQHDLDMDVAPDWTGYRERRFDACRMKEDLPKISDCEHAYFIQVGVQLSCRPSDEAENNILSQGDLTPVGNRGLTWSLGEARGQIHTDPAGRGLVLAITSRSAKTQSLRISTGEDFLIIRAGQATNIVTPVSWCK